MSSGAGKVAVGHPVDVSTGEMFDLWEDAFIDGQMPLAFVRRYSTSALDQPPTAFGRGWTANYFASLRKEGDTYLFTNPEGAVVRFPDPAGAVWSGKPVRNLGAFSELVREGGLLTVVKWVPGQHTSERFQFHPGEPGKAWPLRAHLDASGKAVDIAWDANGRLLGSKQRREKRGFVFRYNDLGRISELEAYGENIRRLQVRYFYDRLGRLIRVENSGTTENFEYDDKDRIIQQTTRTGGQFTFKYDDQGRCVRSVGLNRFFERVFRYLPHLGWTEVTDSMGQVWRYQYLPTGQVVKTLSPMGAEASTAFDAEGRIIERTDGNGAKMTYAYSDEGDYASITNALGQVTTFEHNARHQLTRMVDSSGNPWALAYDQAGNLVSSIDSMGGEWKAGVDARGDVTVIRNTLGHERKFRYDETGNVVQLTDWEGGSYAYAHDGLGRVIARTDPLNRTTRFAYDEKDNVTSVGLPTGETRRFEYDASGNLEAETDEEGQTTRYKWGTCGRLIKSIDAYGAVRRFWWTTEPDRLAKVIDELGREYRFEYDADGRPIKEIDFEGRTFEREFDNAFNMIRIRKADGLETAMEYDLLNRVVKKTLPDGDETAYAYGPLGKLISAANPAMKVEFEYDRIGRMVKETQGTNVVESEYDSEGNRIACRSSLSHEARFSFSPNRDLTALNLDGKWDIGFQRDSMGRELLRELPGGGRLSQRYDAKDRLVEQSVEHPLRGRDLRVAGGEAESYVLGPAQSAMRIFRTFTHAPDGSSFTVKDAHRGETVYGYDRTGRLTSARRESGRSESFDYDPAGNPLRFVRRPGPRDGTDADHGDQDCEYGPGNLLVRKGHTRFTYDEVGRMIRKVLDDGQGPARTWEFGWNGEDYLAWVKTPEGGLWRYAYDAFGRRVSKEGPNGEITRFVWDGDTLLHDIGPKGAKRTWTFDDTIRPVSVIANGEVGLFVNDQAGTPQEILKPDGTVAWAAAYSSWGLVDALLVSEMDNPVRFPGQWFDAESGLHYNRFRQYDPSLGRFLTPDPLRLAGGPNTYQYAPSPTHWQDPFGLATEEVSGAKRGQTITVDRDSKGRIIRSEGPLADPSKLPDDRRLRDENAQKKMSSGTGDDAGHLIGNQFGGPGDESNLVLMCRSMNQYGSWKKMENQLAKLTKNNKVTLVVNVHYDGDSKRPSKFTVTAKITDKKGNETTKRWLHTNC